MSDTVREPQQQRSIDKKNRIIDAGYLLFASKGYFSTNTAEIAKAAGVSTGIVYGYFHDKHDILLEVLDLYIGNVFTPIFDMLGTLKPPIDYTFLLSHVVDHTVEIHTKNAAMHNTLYSLASTDEAVNAKFMAIEKAMTIKFVEVLKSAGFCKPDANERVHLAMEMVQSYAHEAVFDQHDYIDYSKMRLLVIEMLVKLMG